jgi:hypothetical protein
MDNCCLFEGRWPFFAGRPCLSFFQVATVAQMAEQLICNQRVGGSIPFGGSSKSVS